MEEAYSVKCIEYDCAVWKCQKISLALSRKYPLHTDECNDHVRHLLPTALCIQGREDGLQGENDEHA